MTVRERPPLRLHASIKAPNGTVYRWAPDEPAAENVPANITFSTTMPGGFEQAGMTLPRQPAIDYADLTEFSTLTIYGAGGETAWQGRLETTPRVSGTQLSITPGAVGWQAHLDDDKTARMIYIDTDFTRWQGPSVQRNLNLNGSLTDADAPAATADATTGQPSLATSFTGPWSRQHACEAWYDANGLTVAAINYAWKRGTLDNTDTNWSWDVGTSSDDVATGFTSTGSLRAAGPGTGTYSTANSWGVVRLYYAVARSGAGWDGVNGGLFWTYLGVIGNHGLTIRGALSATGGLGVYASDVVQHAVGTWAPKLATSRAGTSTIEQSSFLIPQLAFPDPTTASNIITQALQFGLPDWWVDEGPVFNLASRANHGRDWQARVGPSGLQETGPQVDRLYNSVVVSFSDVTGIKRTVGPAGSGANTIDNTLTDSDPTNPVTAAGLTRRYELDMGIVSTVAGATYIGQTWLASQKLLSTAGQANLVGHVQDSSGIWHPAWQVRAGDRITFTDAHDPVPRRIVRTSYSHDSRTNQLDLDSPPQGLQALLARFAIALTGTGA